MTATRAPSPPTLFYGATLVTLDAEARVVRDCELLVADGRIAAIGRNLTILPGTRLLDVQGHVVLPGFVQGHVHLGQTLFRGLAEGRRLLPWLRERIWPLEAAHDRESAYWSTMLGAVECLLSGTTTVQDIGIVVGAEGLLDGLRDSGLRAVAGKCFMDGGDGVPDRLAEDVDAALSEAESLGGALSDPASGDGLLRYVLNPRFILSCSDTLWEGIVELAERHRWPVHTHALEQKEEGEAVEAIKGRSELDYFSEIGILDADFRIAHGVWIPEARYEELARAGASVVHCPGSNLQLGSGIADVVGLRRAGVRVGLGCDGTACNNNLDALEEARLAARLQRLRHGPGAFSGLDALRLATSDGARALGLEDEIGSLEVGKRADLVVLDVRGPDLSAGDDADWHDVIAFSASRRHVRHVFVGGVQHVEDQRLRFLDAAHVTAEADRARADLLRRAVLD